MLASADEAFLDHVKKGAGEHVGGTPVDLVMKDVYPVIVQQGLGGLFNRIVYKIKGLLYFRQADAVSDVIMAELEHYLFGAKGANQASFKVLRREYEKYMREFFTETPEEPMDAITSGVWKTLLRLFTEHLQESLRGSPKSQLMADLLFDENLALIKQWTDNDHLQIMQLSSHDARMEGLERLREQKKKKSVLARKN
ncbi:conserved hypothetical protein [Neospora caninum Liverpool]|uniref:Dense granule protein DG32 n=1 Tax=Neospora caninum (strain Liverpool) TaxID=572307 RepID=F0V912_NEOCL|nr:conserved hypothetical protein [Neospora caninum Liverpool]CBZ50203.1 conserved hypothetical protein [Neospora caninum Liverpool]CEL64804.1 TPA: dense granule protein DG32 [Neospora caninum Liverpool]|eukprot:XP_003880238.1 conserved hypothetical protein [Neospora caninum Liverpool]